MDHAKPASTAPRSTPPAALSIRSTLAIHKPSSSGRHPPLGGGGMLAHSPFSKYLSTLPRPSSPSTITPKEPSFWMERLLEETSHPKTAGQTRGRDVFGSAKLLPGKSPCLLPPRASQKHPRSCPNASFPGVGTIFNACARTEAPSPGHPSLRTVEHEEEAFGPHRRSVSAGIGEIGVCSLSPAGTIAPKSGMLHPKSQFSPAPCGQIESGGGFR
jgi:hypothetical protein